jgi:hypothetical protein
MYVVFNFGVPVTVHGMSSDWECERERFCMWGADADKANLLQDISGKFERIWLNKWLNI